MSASSKSTKLVNCLIAFAIKNPDFPHPLYDYGFQLETIEPKCLLQNGREVNPDIQFKKNDDHLLFFECKDGNVEKDQLERYKLLTPEAIRKAKMTSLPVDTFSFDLAYFCTKEKEEKIIRSVEDDDNPFPILILDKNNVYHNNISSGFHHTTLKDIFKNIELINPVPENYIPFTVDDCDEIITINLLQHFMSRFEYEFTLDELLDDFFPVILNYYSESGKSALKRRIGNILNALMALEEFSGFFTYKKTDRKYVMKPSGQKKFINACKKYIDGQLIRLHEESKQSHIFDFA